MDDLHFGFEELELWKKARNFKKKIIALVKTFPPEEKYRLADQLSRSSRSINSLIAEGHGRFTYPDQIHFCIQARGSLSETMNHLMDAFDENFLDAEALSKYKRDGKELERLLNGYLAYLRKKRDEIK